MKLHSKLIALILASLMLASAWGCSMPGIGDESAVRTPESTAATVLTDPGTEEATVPLDTTEETEVAVDPGGYTFEDPEEIDFKQETVKILAWSDAGFAEFGVESGDVKGTTLSDALYKRNISVEERLGIELEFVYQSGSISNAKAWNTYLTNCVSAALREYDIVAASSVAIAQNAVTSLLCDLLNDNDFANMFNKPQWSESYVTDARIGSSLYFATGSHSPNMLLSLYFCYANTDHIKYYGLEDPAVLVENGEWTFDKFFEMCRGVYEDDGDGIKDHDGVNGDFFGYMTSNTRTDAWFYASGAKYCETDESGKIIASPTFRTQKVEDTALRLAELLNSSNDGFMADKTLIPVAAFPEGSTIFITEPLGAALDDRIATSEILSHVLLLPMPKYDVSQELYLSVLHSSYTLYAIPADAPDVNRASAVLQAHAAFGYKHVPSAVYLEVFGREQSNDSQSAFFDIVRENVVYDHGRLFAEELIGQNKEFRETAAGNNPELLIRFKQYERLFAQLLESLSGRFY